MQYAIVLKNGKRNESKKYRPYFPPTRTRAKGVKAKITYSTS